MKIVTIIARILLGLVFAVFGSNHLYAWMPVPPPPPGVVGQYMSVMMSTHYFFIVGLFEVIPGLLLLFNRYVPLALTVLAAVIVNILLADILMAPTGLPVGIVVTILWLLVFWRVRSAFAGTLQAKVAD